MLSGFNREAKHSKAKQSKQILRGSFFLLLLEHFQMHKKVVLESCMKQRTCLETFFFPSPFGVVSIVTWHTFEYLQTEC